MSTSRTSSTWRERLASPLTWHFAGFAVLLVLAIGLAIRLGLDWAAMDSHSSEVLAGKQVELKALEFQTAPLRGLDQRVEKSREQMQAFDEKRIPANYSLISSRIGDLEVASGVRLSRVQYTQGKPDSGLTEISMDAGISGDLSVHHALCKQHRARPDILHHPRHDPDRPAKRTGEPAHAALHVAAARGRAHRIAGDSGTG